MLFATYAGLIAILLPLQVLKISDFDDTAKVANLGIVMSVSFIFTLFAQPIVGAFSDRTRSRFGRRTIWMLFGAFIAGILLLAMGSINDLLWLTIFWVVVQVALNGVQGPLTAVIPDRFPRDKRGGASAIMGVGMQLGGLIGVMVASAFAANFGVGYMVFGIGIIVFTVLFAVLNRDWSSKEAKIEPWSWGKFFAGFWINPIKQPDFFWAFAARFLLMLGYFTIASYQLYLLTDYIKVPLAEAPGAVLTLTLIGFVPTIVAIAVSGWWSDKVGRRKIFIYVASVLMVIGFAFPLFMPTMTGMIIMTIINGFGFGFYMSVDTALMTEVLPGDGAAAGKDLGILNIATNIPQALSPAIAALVILVLGGYGMLFVFGMIFVIIAGVAVAPIKAVR
jgi:MFS family permease